MIDQGTFGLILITALITAAIVGVLALAALRIARHASLLARLLILVVGTILSIAAATIAIAREMYISEHDLLVLCWVIGASAVISAGVTTLIGLGLTRSSARLRASARAIGEGRVVPEEVHDGRELADLGHELTETSRRLAEARNQMEQMDESRRRFFTWISHDLRTPLAALRAMAESLEDGVAGDPTRYHRQILGQVQRMSSLVDDLFELSKIQSGNLTLTMERVSLFDLVSDAVADLRPLAAERRQTVRASRTGDLTIWGDARELARVISNLLINAIQHSPAGSEILITAMETGDGFVTLHVDDEGHGIPDADLERVFEAGWRGSTARTPTAVADTSPGAGLGLAIVEGIVLAHSGGVAARNLPNGCRFEVSLPRFAAAAA
ncbi:MAG TPA: HAMP domain-containing sensor histidine kinase [Galbitalea sp.]|jgi:signal transduction histidine kinase